MTIGTLSESNMTFLKDYKKVGYNTMTRLIDEAITLLRNKMEKEIREQRLIDATKGYKEKYVWQNLDGEGYHD